ncbi:MAG: hypothetical protein IPK13_21435 [Deltaproteobacteria bacterium]|nr:hypothetical protein [Deltaproteobacteria bacterium]
MPIPPAPIRRTMAYRPTTVPIGMLCSGLPVTRYASSDIAAALGAGFELVEQADEEHTTPWGAAQSFA